MIAQKSYIVNTILGLLIASILLTLTFLVLDLSFEFNRFLIIHQTMWVLPAGICGGILYTFIQIKGQRLKAERLIVNGIGIFFYFSILLFAYIESIITF